MHVLMTTDCVGGVWTYALTLVRALAALDVRVTLASIGPSPSSSQLRELLESGAVGWCHHPGPLEWMPGGMDAVHDTGDWLAGTAEEMRPDAVHLNSYAYAAWPFTCPVIVAAHSCVCSWWRAVKGESAPREYDRYRAAVSRGLRMADLVVTPTAAMQRALAVEHGFDGRVQVIPNGSDVDDDMPARKEPVVFTAGRLWDEAKNIALIESVAGGLPWPVAAAGDRGGGGAAAANLTWLGVLDRHEITSWMARASIYALPARYEPFGLSILEAARLSCALVLGDIDSLRELWSDAAMFVDPDDGAALANAITVLAMNPDVHACMAKAAHVRASRFTAQALGARYKRAYEALVAQGRHRLSHQVH